MIRLKLALIGLVFFFMGQSFVLAATDPRFQAAMQLAGQQNYAEARQQLNQLLKEDSGNNLYRFNLANVLYLQGEYKYAGEFYLRVAGSKSPLAIPARVYGARSLRKAGELTKAFAALRSVRISELPPTLRKEAQTEMRQVRSEYARQTGMRALQDQQFERAARLLKAYLGVESDPEAYLAYGLANARLGRKQEAAQAIEKGRAMSRDAAVRQDADLLLEQLNSTEFGSKQPTAKRTFFPEASLLIGHDSNFYADASDINESPSAKPIFRFGAKALHLLSQGEEFALNGRYSVSYDGPISSPADRILRYGFEAQGLYLKKGWLAGFFPSFEQVLQNTSPYYLRPAVGLRGRRYWGSWEAGLNYVVTYNVPNSFIYNFLRGTVHERSASLGYNANKYSFDVSFNFDSVLTGDVTSGSSLIPLRHNSWGPTVEAIFQLGRRWELSTLASYRIKNYSTRSLPGLIPRDDKLTELFLQLAYSLDSQWEAFMAADYLSNRSTLGATAVDNKNYQEWITYVGATWRLSR